MKYIYYLLTIFFSFTSLWAFYDTIRIHVVHNGILDDYAFENFIFGVILFVFAIICFYKGNNASTSFSKYYFSTGQKIFLTLFFAFLSLGIIGQAFIPNNDYSTIDNRDSLQYSIENTAKENGNFDKITVKQIGESFEVKLNCPDEINESQCDLVVDKIIKKAYSAEKVPVDSIFIHIDGYFTNALNGKSYIDEIARYTVKKEDVSKIDFKNTDTENTVKVAHKYYHRDADLTKVNTKQYNDTKAKYGIN